MIKQTYNLVTITPIYVGGANQNEIGNLSKAIKSQLAFWWRASQSETKAEDLFKLEQDIFGGILQNDNNKGEDNADSKTIVKASTFYVDVKIFGSSTTKNLQNNFTEIDSTSRSGKIQIDLLKYSGFGKYKNGNESYAVPIKSKLVLTFSMVGKANRSATIEQCLNLLCLFGGIGGKSRNAWGKIFLEKHTLNIEEEFKGIKSNFQNVDYQFYPSFSKHVRLFKMDKIYDNPLEVIAELTRIYRKARVGNTINGDQGIDATIHNPTGRHSIEKRKFIARPANTIPVVKIEEENSPRVPKSFHFSVLPVLDKNLQKYIGYALFMPWKAFDDNNFDNYIKANNELIRLMSNYGLNKEILP